jgi:hypothetical protein
LASLTYAEALLRTIMLPTIIAFEFENTIFSNRTVRTSSNIKGGDIKVTTMIQAEQGIGSRARGEVLPAPSDAKFEQATATLKHHYAAIELYGQDMIMSEGNDNERLAEILSTKVASIGQAFATDINRQYWLDGTGVLTTVKTGVTGTQIVVNSTQYLRRGMKVTINDDSVTITNIKYSTNTITVNTSITVVADETVVRYGNADNEITGIGAMIGDTGTYLGLSRADYEDWASLIVSHSSAIDLVILDEFFGRLIAEKDSVPSVCYTDEKTVRWLKYLYQAQGIPLEYMNINMGYKAIQYVHPKGVIPFVIEPFCPEANMYVIDERYMTLREPRPIHWMPGYDGKIWRLSEGYDKEVAHIRYYSELFNINPRTCGRLYNYTSPIS